MIKLELMEGDRPMEALFLVDEHGPPEIDEASTREMIAWACGWFREHGILINESRVDGVRISDGS